MPNYRQINYEVMNDTKKHYTENEELKTAVQNSISRQYMVAHEDTIALPDMTDRETHYLVSGKRTFEAAKDYKGKKLAVLNFANNHSIGGAPFSAGAQEESLCRCSTLFPCLEAMRKPFYQKHKNDFDRGIINFMGNDDLIYTPDIVVFKTDERADPIYPKMLPKDEWYKVDVITCAAPDFRGGQHLPKNYESQITSRIRKILDVACRERVEVLILGAWGCGAFKNPSEIVARVFHTLLPNYDFETVEFALDSRDDVSNSVFAMNKSLMTFVTHDLRDHTEACDETQMNILRTETNLTTLQSVHEFATKLSAYTRYLEETKDPGNDILRDAGEICETAEKMIQEVGYNSIYFDRMSLEYFRFLDGFIDYLFDTGYVYENVDPVLELIERYLEGHDAYSAFIKTTGGDYDKIHSEIFGDCCTMYKSQVICYKQKGEFDKAKTAIQKVIDAIEDPYGIYDEYYSSLYEELGIINWHLGEIDAAIEAIEKARSMIALADDEARDVSLACTLWKLYEEKGDYENALKCANFYSNFVDFYDPLSDESFESFVELAELYLKAGDLNKAEHNLERVLSHYNPESDYKPNWLPSAYRVYSIFYTAKGDQSKAKEYLEKAYADYIELFGEDDEVTQSVKEQLEQYNAETK